MRDEDIDETGVLSILRGHETRQNGSRFRDGHFRAGWRFRGCEKARVLIQFHPFGDPLSERITAQEIDHRIDHVQACDGLLADAFHVLQHAILFLFETEDPARPDTGFLPV